MLNTGIPPRARGRASGCRRANHPQGIPPRARGRAMLLSAGSTMTGHTPACAGASAVALFVDVYRRAYPRVRGGEPSGPHPRGGRCGILPRARGRGIGESGSATCWSCSLRGFRGGDDRSLERVEPLIDPAEPLLHRSHPLVEPVVVLLHLVVQAVDPRAQFGSCPIDACPEFASHVSQFGPHRPDFSLDVPQLVRNQQVSGSSPLAGSNRINNLQGFSG